ncbi:unnamed protein product [Lepidochelys kempii]
MQQVSCVGVQRTAREPGARTPCFRSPSPPREEPPGQHNLTSLHLKNKREFPNSSFKGQLKLLVSSWAVCFLHPSKAAASHPGDPRTAQVMSPQQNPSQAPGDLFGVSVICCIGGARLLSRNACNFKSLCRAMPSATEWVPNTCSFIRGKC